MIKKRFALQRFVILLVLFLFNGVLASCASGTSESAVQPTEELSPTALPTAAIPTSDINVSLQEDVSGGDPERGREIFFNGGADELYQPEYACATCHSLDGTVGAEEKAGPSLLGVSARAGERVPGLSAEEYLRQSIEDPKAFVAPTYSNKMTRIGAKYLSPEELDDLVAFLLTLNVETVPAADMSPTPEAIVDLGMSIEEGDPNRGRLLPATTYRCVACHMDDEITGYGPRFSSTDDLPPIWERGQLRIADPGYEGQATTNQEYILESIFQPTVYIVPGEWEERMPNTFHMHMSDQELAEIMAWLETID